MSYGTMVYSVDFDKLRAIFGSGDNGTRRAISGRFKRDIYRLNDDFDWSNERGEASVFEALRHMIMGGEPVEGLEGAMYGYGYKFIVEFFGRFMPNSCFYPCNSSHQSSEIQPQLDAHGVKLSLFSLSFGGAVGGSFPMPDDFPGFGYWSPEAVASAHEIMKDLDGLSDELAEIRGWLSHASAEGHGLVGFYH